MPNEVKYIDQVWPASGPCEGEQLSANGYMTGQHIGSPMQDKMYNDCNNDPYYVEHVTTRYGTIMEDKQDDALNPEQGIGVAYVLTGCTATPLGAAKKSVKLDIKVKAESGYTLPDAVTVKRAGSALTATTHYTWTKSSGTLSINADQVTDDLEVTVTATKA